MGIKRGRDEGMTDLLKKFKTGCKFKFRKTIVLSLFTSVPIDSA
jgi:hypothetical protein